MPGCANVRENDLADNPDLLHEETPAEFYNRLFGGDGRQTGYMQQARMLQLHQMITERQARYPNMVCFHTQSMCKDACLL